MLLFWNFRASKILLQLLLYLIVLFFCFCFVLFFLVLSHLINCWNGVFRRKKLKSRRYLYALWHWKEKQAFHTSLFLSFSLTLRRRLDSCSSNSNSYSCKRIDSFGVMHTGLGLKHSHHACGNCSLISLHCEVCSHLNGHQWNNTDYFSLICAMGLGLVRCAESSELVENVGWMNERERERSFITL